MTDSSLTDSPLPDLSLLTRIEPYLDCVPRSEAAALAVGAFTLFVADAPGAGSYYARPAVAAFGSPGRTSLDTADIDFLRQECAAVGVPLSIEWVDEACPSLAAAAGAAGLVVNRRPLLALGPAATLTAPPIPAGAQVKVLVAGDPLSAVGRAVAEVGFGFPGTERGVAGTAQREGQLALLTPEILARMERRAAAGETVTAVSVTVAGVVCVGQHQPVGTVTEIVGVATLPVARRKGHAAAVTFALAAHALAHGIEVVLLSADDESVARIYRRLGFRLVGTSCSAEPKDVVDGQ